MESLHHDKYGKSKIIYIESERKVVQLLIKEGRFLILDMKNLIAY